MKKILFLSVAIFSLFACNKENEAGIVEIAGTTWKYTAATVIQNSTENQSNDDIIVRFGATTFTCMRIGKVNGEEISFREYGGDYSYSAPYIFLDYYDEGLAEKVKIERGKLLLSAPWNDYGLGLKIALEKQ